MHTMKLSDSSKTSLVDLQSPLTSSCLSALPSPTNSSVSSDSHLCWICFDEETGELLIANACGCTSRQVHASCLARWIYLSKHKECKVCTKEWPSIFLNPSDIVMLHHQPARGLERFFFGEIACYVVTCMFSLGFVYGLLYATCASTASMQMFVSLAFNILVVAFWNQACASTERRSSGKFALQDGALLVGTYMCFLVSWGLGYYIVRSDVRLFLLDSIMAHAINFGFCFFVITLRLFCVARGDEEN